MQLTQNARHGYVFIKSEYGHFDEIPESWKLKQINEIGKIVSGGTPDTSNTKYWNGNIPWAVPTDITSLKNAFISRTQRCISEDGLKKSSAKILPVGTILLTTRATIGECAINTIPTTTNQGFQNIVCNPNYHNLFIYYALKFFEKKLLRVAYGTTFLEISKSNLKGIKIPVPTLSEQQKIASILERIDKQIQKTNQIIEQTQGLKKGLMQKLLAKGIKHTKFKKVLLFPRYSDEIIPETWSVHKIDDLLEIIDYRGRTPPFSESGIIHLRSNNIRDGKINFEELTYVSTKTYEEYMTRGIPRENDVLFTTEGPLGEVALVPDNFKFSLAQRIIVLRPKSGKILPRFLKYLLLDRKVRIRYYALATGTTLSGIASKWFTKLLLPYPIDTQEQQIIYSHLDEVENRISYEKNIQLKYQTLKKGLMQKLLTGKIRVRV